MISSAAAFIRRARAARAGVAFGLLLLAARPLAATDYTRPVTLKSAEPFRLLVSSTGSPQRLTVAGDNFEGESHPSRDQYMHWQVRRDDGGWEPCAQWNVRSSSICHGTGWTAGSDTLEIGGKFLVRPGFIEVRLFSGLADETATDPSAAPTGHTEWSNVLRVPVVVPGPAPTIESLSKSVFPIAGEASDFDLVIDAGGVEGTPVVVFRGDTVVWPGRFLDGHLIEVAIPAPYRLTSPGELPLTVRTDRGGQSAPVYIKFVAPTLVAVRPGGALVPGATLETQDSGAAPAHLPSGACRSGFVWREAGPGDRVCVTPETRAETARQNREGAAHRAPNGSEYGPDACAGGYVWRDAFTGDHVCVTPQERAQAAEDNRLAALRVAE